MVSDKFIKRFEKLKNESDDGNDIRITKRYIDESDNVFNFPSYINNNLDDWKSIIIDFETRISNIYNDDFALKLSFIAFKDQHGNIISEFKNNKAFEKFNADTKNFLYKVGYHNNICFNTVVTAVTISRTK